MHDIRELAIELLKAIGEFDAAALERLIAPNGEYWVAGMPRDQRISRGDLLSAIQQMGGALFDGPIRFTVHDMTVEGGRIALEATSEAKLRDGRPYANVYHFLFLFEDGRLILGKEYADTMILATLTGQS